jgi:hypothetical protein
MLIHLFVSVPRNEYLDEDMPDDEGIPDFPEEDIPACPIPSQLSRFPSSTGSPRPGPANQSYAPPRNSMPWWNMATTMCQAGVSAELCRRRNIYQNT